MSRDMNQLNPNFKDKAKLLLSTLEKEGINMRPFFTIRDLPTQARLYRQSRTGSEIRAKIRWLEQEGAFMLADVLNRVGPCHGKWATNCLPGYSWHNWGEAMDCFLVNPDGTANWDNNAMGYEHYAGFAEDLDLTSGHRWKSRDSVHVQLRGHSSPRMTPSEVSDLMTKIWQS